MTVDTQLLRSFKQAVLNITAKEGQPATLGTAGGTVYYNDGSNDHLNRVWVRMGAEKQVLVVAKVGKKGIPNLPGLEVNVSKRFGSLYVDDWPAISGIGGTTPGTELGGHVHEFNTRTTSVDDSAAQVGTDNVIIGNTAGDSLGTSSYNNVVVGSAAGAVMNATGQDNVIVGYNAGNAATGAAGSASISSYGSSTDIGDADMRSLAGTSAAQGYRSFARISDTKAVLLREQDSSPYAIEYNIVTVSGDTITPGSWGAVDSSPQTEDPDSVMSISSFDGSKVVVAWLYDTGTAYSGVKVRCGTVSGTTISWGSEQDWDSIGATNDIVSVDVAMLSNSHFIVAYSHGLNTIEARALSLSGTSITVGAEYQVEGTNSQGGNASVCPLSSTQAVICYVDSVANSEVGQGKVATRSGTALSFGSADQYSGADIVRHIKCVALTSTLMVVGFKWWVSGAGYKWYNTAGSISGSTVTFGTPALADSSVLDSGDQGNTDAIDGTRFLTIMEEGPTDDEFFIGTVSGTTITYSTVDVNTGQNSDDGHLAGVLSSTQGLMIYYRSVGFPDFVAAYTVNFDLAEAIAKNTFIGANAGQAADDGLNTFIGFQAGGSNTGQYCVSLGVYAGENNTTDNRLFIDISNTTTPLIYGEFDDDNLGINTTDMAGGVGVIAIADAGTTPAGTPTGGGVLFVESGALTYKGSSGTETVLGVA